MAGIGIKGSQNNDNEFLYEQPADSSYYVPVVNVNSRQILKTATIAISQSLSGEVDIEGCSFLMGMVIPSAWTAASLSFQAATVTGGPFYNLYIDTGPEASVAAAGSVAVALWSLGSAIAPYRFLKVRSGVAGTPVPQGQAVTLTLVLKT